MSKWPTSGWAHAGIAFAGALILSVVAYCLGERSAYTYLVRTDPQHNDAGWYSLGAAAGGVAAAFWTFLIALVLIFVIQRLFRSEGSPDE